MGGFYDGLIDDLMAVKSYQLAQVIYSEKQREKFKNTVKDQFTGLEIFAAQKKTTEYSKMFNELIDEKGPFTIDQQICEELVRTLAYFEAEEEFKPQMLEMVEKV